MVERLKTWHGACHYRKAKTWHGSLPARKKKIMSKEVKSLKKGLEVLMTLNTERKGDRKWLP
jgi:hypothetical protein